MSEFAVELRDVSKVFPGGRPTDERVTAVYDINLAIRQGEFFTLLGPSGCGKTTTLRMIAGFETPSKGELLIDSRPMIGVPPYHRPVNIVFQNYALFPHLSVAENVAFGLTIKRIPKAERDQRVREALELVRLPGLENRKPSQLSGGQQQRVALARALVNRPAVLLLDEPLGALDLKLRKIMQVELKHLQTQVGITFIYVTHDQEEALTMSDRIAVMDHGVVLQVDTPVAIYERPATRFVADFIGETNLLDGSIDRIDPEQVTFRVGEEHVMARHMGNGLYPGHAATLAIRPEKLTINRESMREVPSLTGTVRDVIYLGTDTRFLVELASGQVVTVRVQNTHGRGLGEFAVGDTVRIAWQPEDARMLTA